MTGQAPETAVHYRIDLALSGHGHIEEARLLLDGTELEALVAALIEADVVAGATGALDADRRLRAADFLPDDDRVVPETAVQASLDAWDDGAEASLARSLRPDRIARVRAFLELASFHGGFVVTRTSR